MIGFIIGLFVGGFFGVATMCIMSVAGHDDIMYEDNDNHAQADDCSSITNAD